MSKVTITFLELLAAGTAYSRLARDAHERVHGPVGREGARVVGGISEVVDVAIGYFDDGLVYDVLVRVDAKLDVLDARRNAVHNLRLRQRARRLHVGVGMRL